METPETKPKKASIDDLFPADRDLIDEYVVFELKDGSELHVRRIDNPQFQGFYETMQKKHKFSFDHNLLSEEEKRRFLTPGVAKYVLVGWKNFPPAAPVPYSREKAEELLRERKSMMTAVLGMAAESRAFVREREELAEKNSASGSLGISSGASS